MSTVTVNTTLIERPTVYGNIPATDYRIAEVLIPGVATAGAGGAGQAVTTSIVFNPDNLPSNLNYCIQAVPSQACAISYSSKAVTGFNIVLTPLSGGTTLSAGTVDIIVTWSVGV